MTTKTSDKTVILFLCTLLLSLLPATSADLKDKKWTLGASVFTFTQKRSFSNPEKDEAALLPKLILEQIAEQLERLPPAQEQLDRTLYDLQTKRIALFLQLSKEMQTRDALVLGGYGRRELKSKLVDEDDKISSLKKQIAENLDIARDEERKAAPAIRKDKEREENIAQGKIEDDINADRTDDAALLKKMLKDFVPGARRNSEEQLAFYKDDASQLFDAGNNVTAKGIDSYEFEKAVTTAQINGLIIGKITIYGDYMSVTAELLVYPGARSIGVVTEVGSTADLQQIAQRIANQLTPKISNGMPVELTFSVQPSEAVSELVVTVDDVAYRTVPEKLIVQSGIHSLMFTAPGYVAAGTSFSFRGRKAFRIDVKLQKDTPGVLNIKLKRPYTGTFYADGIKASSVDESNRIAQIQVNGQPVLGQFITSDGTAASYYIPDVLAQNGMNLAVNAKPFDRSAFIEKRRRRMYTAYSLFIVSLIPTFYTYGSFVADLNAYNAGCGDYDTAHNMQISSYVTSGISIGCAVFWVFELGRYFSAANSTLPARAKKGNYELPPEEKSSLETMTPAENQTAADEKSEKVVKQSVSH